MVMRREKLHGIGTAPDGAADLVLNGDAKTLVMSHVGQLVADGYAEWDVLPNGDVELRFHTGEIFILAEMMVVRIA
jgi:hypothetical protein